jgi:hypothetical protein
MIAMAIEMVGWLQRQEERETLEKRRLLYTWRWEGGRRREGIACGRTEGLRERRKI